MTKKSYPTSSHIKETGNYSWDHKSKSIKKVISRKVKGDISNMEDKNTKCSGESRDAIALNEEPRYWRK